MSKAPMSAARRAEEAIEEAYEMNGGSELLEEYHRRHGIESMLILTVTGDAAARKEVATFADQIRGKRVVEIGSGVGFLAIAMAEHAKSVVAIEADVQWTAIFASYLYAMKPKNLTWIFGAAETVAPWLRGDVAVIYTRSGQEEMGSVARKMCKGIIWGPRLSIEEHHPDIPEEVKRQAREFASSLNVADITSRLGVSRERIEATRLKP